MASLSSVVNVSVGSIGTAVVSFIYSLFVSVASASLKDGRVAISFLGVAQANRRGSIRLKMINNFNVFIIPPSFYC